VGFAVGLTRSLTNTILNTVIRIELRSPVPRIVCSFEYRISIFLLYIVSVIYVRFHYSYRVVMPDGVITWEIKLDLGLMEMPISVSNDHLCIHTNHGLSPKG
jgi:hypothetical protein